MLKIVDLNYSAGKKKILKNLNLTLEKGTIHSILGANGTGKTTLGYVLMGLSGYKPQSGKIFLNSTEITDKSITERANLGLTLAWQHSTSFEGISIRDYLSIAARKTGFDYTYAMKRLGLNPDIYLDRNYDSTLSGGERKRVELCAIMSMITRVAILDEPDSGIDVLSIETIIDVIREINRNGSTILLITHNWRVAREADTASTLCDGSILYTGNPEDVANFFIKQCEKCNHINKPEKERVIQKK